MADKSLEIRIIYAWSADNSNSHCFFMRIFLLLLFTIIFAVTILVLLSCTTAPFNPYDISNAKITILPNRPPGLSAVSSIEDYIPAILLR